MIIGLCMAFCFVGVAQETASETNVVPAEKKIIKGCSGGMMLNTGYMSGIDNPYGLNIHGVTFGVGGVARVHLSNHLRVGFEGYFSNVGLSKILRKGSFNKVFWTGALVDWFWHVGKFYPYIGASIGGGMETAYYMFEGNRNDWLPETKAVFNKDPFFAIDPFVGIEYQLKGSVHLTLKADYLLGLRNSTINQPSGPRIYFGIIFTH